ncbi:MAG: hypothetical protein HQL44_12190 [Alphaproteobacteria bacterium]|nr:hypothetical protein [Alphaproteobacteria bacterium]
MARPRSWARIRTQRDKRLKKALAVLERHRTQKDFMLDTTICDAKAKEWADYAQDLRDVTLQTASSAIIWPDEPGE